MELANTSSMARKNKNISRIKPPVDNDSYYQQQLLLLLAIITQRRYDISRPINSAQAFLYIQIIIHNYCRERTLWRTGKGYIIVWFFLIVRYPA